MRKNLIKCYKNNSLNATYKTIFTQNGHSATLTSGVRQLYCEIHPEKSIPIGQVIVKISKQ